MFKAVQTSAVRSVYRRENVGSLRSTTTGYRAQVPVIDGEVRIFTKSGLDWTDRVPAIAEAARAVDIRSTILVHAATRLRPRPGGRRRQGPRQSVPIWAAGGLAQDQVHERARD